MKVLIRNSAELAQQAVTDILTERVIAHPASVIGLATGGTVEAVYDRLILALADRRAPVQAITTFNLDEYWGVAPDQPAT